MTWFGGAVSLFVLHNNILNILLHTVKLHNELAQCRYGIALHG